MVVPGMVAQASNRSYSGGRDPEDSKSRPTSGKNVRPYLKNNLKTKMGTAWLKQ
jgi:hypothetical protein